MDKHVFNSICEQQTQLLMFLLEEFPLFLHTFVQLLNSTLKKSLFPQGWQLAFRVLSHTIFLTSCGIILQCKQLLLYL